MGQGWDALQPPYASARVNGTGTRPSDGPRAQGYPPHDARTRGYPRSDSGPMPAYQPPDGRTRAYARPDSGPMPAYQPPDGRTRAYARPDSGPFPAYVLPNGGGVGQGYPPLDGRPTAQSPPPPSRRPGYPPADSGPMPAYRTPRTRLVQEHPPADDRAAFGYPRPGGRAAPGGYAPVGGKSIMGWLPFGNRLVLLPRDTQFDGYQEVRQHRDISGGWLRPAVFGAMDGLVTNSSLIAGVGAGGSGHGMIVLTGIAGLIAGAFSMATGEFISVTSQNDLTKAEIEIERLQHLHDPKGKLERLTEIYTEKGVSPNLAEAVVRQISADPDRAVDAHVRAGLGIDPDDLPSPRTAATASFAAFTVGALIPLSPFLLGFPVLSVALGVSAAAALVGGAALAKLTGKSMLLGGLRQFTAAFLATGAAFAIGHLIAGRVM
jgi:VIT1/CCC1 family predicted Fe2+/Mn2+ transporter